ncbi:uncharacterized protein LOC141693836 [Apium graveolens]|uniref:uncharacterized protein LOC141693836 n=1 Tax=Apium graveolens TaxID=4045 RepID=UPI003D7906F0
MGTRIWLVIIFVLGASRASDSRELMTSSVYTGETAEISFDTVLQVTQDSEKDILEIGKNYNVCTLCKEYTAEALTYLDANKTQEEIIHILHGSCSKLHSLKEECLVLVDYYALFFSEISSIEPADFCQKVNLCEQVALNSQHTSKNSCELCHYAIAEALIKLKDPDTELDIIEVLLKACKAVKGYETKCKRMVFEYGPLILINAEQWLESNDICNILHACDASKSDYSKHLQ